MKREKIIGGFIVFIIMTFLAWPLHNSIPLPSSYILMSFVFNAIFAFVSIFLQRLVIVLYESNVFEKPASTMGYTFKYFAIFSSGINYYFQMICNRLPFVLNKLVALIFFVFIALSAFNILFIFGD